ncbi:MAG: GAF domain-containing protein, partial [Leeuwenhoekiella sp.]
SQSSISRDYMQSLLDYAESFPNLINGIDDFQDLDKYKDPIRVLLDNLFPAVLTKNEIKAASVPFHNTFFNPTHRFTKILKNSGEDFELKIRNLNEDVYYVIACVVILNTYYNKNVDFSKTLFFDIPDDKGLLRHYRVAMNADFVSFEPKDAAIEITDEIVNKLIQNVNDIELWKSYFPPKSWILKGITIITLTDVTVDDAISELKTTLLYGNTMHAAENSKKFEEIFQAIFNIADLKLGFTEFNEEEGSFMQMDKEFAKSYILDNESRNDCRNMMCEGSYNSLIENNDYFCISDVEQYAADTKHDLLSENLLNQGIKSCILAPIIKGNKVLAVLELVSHTKNQLHSLNAMKLDDVIPYIVATVERKRFETENRIKAVIQSECTSIHPSVLWVFEEEAKKFIANQNAGKFASFKDIAFKDVYPLYGQIDIVGSSEERNSSIQKDILIQLKLVDGILVMAMKTRPLSIYEQVKFRIEEFISQVTNGLSASSETEVFNLLRDEVNPLLNHLNTSIPELKKAIDNYKATIRTDTGLIYENRKHYDETVQLINQKLATFLDRKQQEAQKIFPHYFERYKT